MGQQRPLVVVIPGISATVPSPMASHFFPVPYDHLPLVLSFCPFLLSIIFSFPSGRTQLLSF